MTNGSLMKVEKYCRMLPLEHSAILLTCIKQLSVLKTIFGLFESVLALIFKVLEEQNGSNLSVGGWGWGDSVFSENNITI